MYCVNNDRSIYLMKFIILITSVENIPNNMVSIVNNSIVSD